MQTLIDPFELSYSTKAYLPKREESGTRLIPPMNGARATLLDVDEIAWFDDDDSVTGEVLLELDLEGEIPHRHLAPCGRGARVWTSED